VSRRGGLPWAPTSVPQLRRQWCQVLGEGLGRLQEQAAAPAELLARAEQDLAGIEQSTLYWVVRDMVDLALGAAASLPEWSPAAAIPAEYGMLCWAKPVGTFDWPAPGTGQSVRMPIDAMLWGVRGGQVGVSCAVRTDRVADQLGAGYARFPLLSHPVGVWDLEEPVSHRLEGGAVSPLSVLGCAWLLMEQPTVTQSRQIRSGAGTSDPDSKADDDAVSIIELRRSRAGDGAGAGESAGRKISKRFLVSGHWRQQACGPGRKLR
jgi:hypothetical protein